MISENNEALHLRTIRLHSGLNGIVEGQGSCGSQDNFRPVLLLVVVSD